MLLRNVAGLNAFDPRLLHPFPCRRKRALRVDFATGVFDHCHLKSKLARI